MDKSFEVNRASSENVRGDFQTESTIMNAVEVRGGYKYYGKDKDPKIILNRLDMNVSHGSM